MAILIVTEGVNLFQGNDPTTSRHLNLESVGLPELEEKTDNHIGGGMVGEIDIGMGVYKPLEIKFKSKGVDIPMMRDFGLGSAKRLPYTIVGARRDRITGEMFEMKAHFEGRLVQISQDDMKRGENQSFDFTFKEVFHYELYERGEQLFYYDVLTNKAVSGGIDPNEELNRILRIS